MAEAEAEALHGEALILAELDALREVWPEARIRSSFAGYTWQVWTYTAQLSVPVGEPTGNPQRMRERAAYVKGKTGRFMLDDMEAAGIPWELRMGEVADG